MPEINPITVPKLVFQQFHPEETKVFKEVVLSGAFRLAMSAAMAEFQSHCPTEEQGRGAVFFAQIFQEIGEVEKAPQKLPRRSLKRFDPEPPVNKWLIPTPATPPTQ